MNRIKYLVIAVFALAITTFFNNCGPVKFSSSQKSSETSPAVAEPPTGSSNNNGAGTGSGTNSSTPQRKDISTEVTVTPPNNKLDLLLIVDDSGSMAPDGLKLAQKLSTFVSSLQSSSIDWQMCLTTTRALKANNVSQWGLSIVWSNYTKPAGVEAWVLKPSSNLSQIFVNTITSVMPPPNTGWENSDDERGIKSAYWHFYNGEPGAEGNSGCYRSDAALSVILISDEDERSVGGDHSRAALETEKNKPLEDDDKPEVLMTQVKTIFGSSKRFTFNSIVIKSNDSTCLQKQRTEDPVIINGKSYQNVGHEGTLYEKMSALSGGGIGSICDADYSTNLNLFKDFIQDSISALPLECTPIGNKVDITISPTFVTTPTVQGASIVFEPKLPAGRKVSLKYSCDVFPTPSMKSK